MSSIMHPNAKKTHGHKPDKQTGEVKPVDALVDRNQQLKHITKSLLHYYKGQSQIQAQTAKSTLALTECIQVPFHEGHAFMGEGGWQEVLYEVRDKTKTLAEHHTTLANTLETTVVKELEGVRSDLKAHISAIEKEAGALAIEVDKERAESARVLTLLQEGIHTFDHGSEQMRPQNDPFLVHTAVQKQLVKQVHKENDLQSSLIRFQQQQPSFEKGILTSVQSACKLYESAFATKQKDIEATEKEIMAALQRVSPDAEYEFFSSREGAVLDPNTPLRSFTNVTFPGLDHASTAAVQEGYLERKKRWTKSYKESYYILTPSGYLHERKSNDQSVDSPMFSLFLPECVLGPPSKESDKSHKFHVEGNKAIKSSFESKVKNTLRFGGKEIAYTFRARTHAEMLKWHAALDKMSRETKTANPSASHATVSPVAAAVANVGLAEPTVEPTKTDLPIKEGGLADSVNPDVEQTQTNHAAEEEDDEISGGSSAEEEDDEARAIRTAPATPAAESSKRIETASLKEAKSAATGPAEELPTYQGNGTAAPEKGGLAEKGQPAALGGASTSS